MNGADFLRTREGRGLRKSRARVKRYGEVFTPDWMVAQMCDILEEESPVQGLRGGAEKMKAWEAWCKESCEPYATIVFAETPGMAKVAALATDTCESGSFTDIRLRREPRADKLYRGSCEIDWWDEKTRLFLVRDLKWSCNETNSECAGCVAREFCARFEGE